MNIKSFIAVTVLAIAGVTVACEKSSSVNPAQKSERQAATLNVHVSSTDTKATTTASENDEAKVSSIEILVFNENGGLDAYKSSTGSSLTVTGVASTSGNKTVVAVINAPSSAKLNEVTNLPDLRAKRSSLVVDNSLTNFVMYGEKAVNLVASATNDVTVNVDRLVARIRIDKITRKFQSSMPGLVNLPASDFEIVRFFLSNVAADVNYGSLVSLSANTSWLVDETPLTATPPTSVAINKNELLYSAAVSTSDANKLAQDASYENTHRLYAYPNASSSQVTKLFVEIKIEGKYYTYPIAFPNLQSNYSYEVRNMTITRLGNYSNGDDNLDPDEPVDPIVPVEFDLDIVVNPWDLVLMGENNDGNITI